MASRRRPLIGRGMKQEFSDGERRSMEYELKNRFHAALSDEETAGRMYDGLIDLLNRLGEYRMADTIASIYGDEHKHFSILKGMLTTLERKMRLG